MPTLIKHGNKEMFIAQSVTIWQRHSGYTLIELLKHGGVSMDGSAWQGQNNQQVCKLNWAPDCLFTKHLKNYFFITVS
jgi:hypothetical protein